MDVDDCQVRLKKQFVGTLFYLLTASWLPPLQSRSTDWRDCSECILDNEFLSVRLVRNADSQSGFAGSVVGLDSVI